MASELVLRETDAQVEQTDQLITKLEEAMQDEPEKVASDVDMIDNPVARALEERIGILTVELSDLQQKYTDADRRVQDKKAQILELRAEGQGAAAAHRRHRALPAQPGAPEPLRGAPARPRQPRRARWRSTPRSSRTSRTSTSASPT